MDHQSAQSGTTDEKQGISLKLSGMSYLLGDAAMFASGMLAQTKEVGAAKGDMRKKAATGLLWGLGGAATAIYGNPNQEKQLEILARKLERHLKANGADVTDATRDRTELLRHHSLWDKVNGFLYEHPSEALNAVFAVGAGTLLMTKDNTKRAIGALVGTGALAGLLIKEDKDAPEKAKDGNPLQKALAWAQEKPLRVTGALYLANNAFTVLDALNDRKKYAHMHFTGGLKPHYFTFLTAASYIVANGLLFMSPRNQVDDQHFDASQVAQLEQVATEIIAAQPKERRQALLQSVSEFLVKEKAIPMDVQQLSQKLNAHVDSAPVRRVEAKGQWQSRYETQRRAAELQPLAK